MRGKKEGEGEEGGGGGRRRGGGKKEEEGRRSGERGEVGREECVRTIHQHYMQYTDGLFLYRKV